MPGLHDIDVSGFIKEQLPSFVQENGSQQFQAFLEAYYQWLELVQIDVTRDVSELFYRDQTLFGTRSQAQATIFAVKKLDDNNSRIWVRYISEKKFFTNETLYTEGLSWDDEVAEHADRFDVEFWSKSPGADYTAPVKEVYYNVILATSYMLNLEDIDYTDLAYFEETYRKTLLHNFPELEEKRYVNERQLAKMIRTFNNRKGVDKTIKFLFKLVYGEDIEVFFPNTLLLRASDGRWNQPIVTFLGNIPTQYTLSDFVGMRIRGKQSRVEAIVINSYKNQLPNKEVNVLELQGLPDWVDETGPGIPGNPTIDEFIVGEEIEVLPATFIEAENFENTFEANLTATIRGGVGEIEIYAAGSGYSPGQMITLTGQGGAEAKAEIRLISNNYAVDFINVNSQGTGYIIGDELEWQPAFSGGINQSAEVGELTDTYTMYHSFQQIYPYGSFILTANATWEYNTREAANIALYYTIQLPTVFANGDAVYSHNLHPFEDYNLVQGQNITFTHSEGTENAYVQVQHGDKNATFRVRLYENNAFSKATHPIHEINEITLEDGTTYDRIQTQGDVHANVEFQHMRIDDSIVYINQIFGGLKTVNITSTGKEFFDVPGVTVRGRSNTGVYQSWTSNTEYVPPLGQQFGKYSTSAYNVITIQTEESSFVFANGWSNADPTYPDSRVDVIEAVRSNEDPTQRKFVHGNNAMGETRAELVGVLDLESIAYFVQEDYGDPQVIDTFFILLEDDPFEEDRFVAEGDTVVMKVLFNEDVADPFLSSQTMIVRDADGNQLLQFDASTVTDFRKMGTDGVISVPYLATNSIFDVTVLDPGSDYGADFLPIADTNTYGNMNAILIPHLTGTIKYDGDWKGYHGMLSSPHVLQDSYYWQDFSYSIRSGFEIAVYRDLVKRLLHIAGEQLFGEMLITINVNAQLYSGGEYGGKYDNNYLIDENSHTNGPFGGPFQDRPFFNLEREFLFTGPDGTVAPYGTSPWPNNPDDQYAQIDGRMYDIQINHEPIPHDGLFYANGAPVTWVVTPGKRYANYALNEVMDRFIVENPALRPEGLLMEEQDGSLNPQYIYSEFPDVLGDNQFNHGQRVDWTMFRDMRERGEIVWIDDSLEAQRFGYPHQVPDDSFEGAWYWVDLEGKNLICEDATGNHSLIYEDSNQDLFFPTETYTSSVLNGATVISNITNSSEMVIEGLALNTDQYTGVKVGQEVEVTFSGYEPGFQDSGYNIEISEPFNTYNVAVEPAYEEFRGQMQSAATFSPGDGTWGRMNYGMNPYVSHGGGPHNNGDVFAFQNGMGNPFYQSGTAVGDFVYVGDQQGNIGYYQYEGVVGGIFAAWELTYISGHRFTDPTQPPHLGGPMDYHMAMGTIETLYDGKVNLTDTAGNGINRADFTASIEEIGLIDPAIESLTVTSGGNPTPTNPSVYSFEHLGSSNYYAMHVSGPVLDWGGPTDVYGGAHNAILRQTIDQVVEIENDTGLPNGNYDLVGSTSTASALTTTNSFDLQQSPDDNYWMPISASMMVDYNEFMLYNLPSDRWVEASRLGLNRDSGSFTAPFYIKNNNVGNPNYGQVIGPIDLGSVWQNDWIYDGDPMLDLIIESDSIPQADLEALNQLATGDPDNGDWGCQLAFRPAPVGVADAFGVDVYPGYNYGTFTVDGVDRDADVRVRNIGSDANVAAMFSQFDSIPAGTWVRIGAEEGATVTNWDFPNVPATSPVYAGADAFPPPVGDRNGSAWNNYLGSMEFWYDYMEMDFERMNSYGFGGNWEEFAEAYNMESESNISFWIDFRHAEFKGYGKGTLGDDYFNLDIQIYNNYMVDGNNMGLIEIDIPDWGNNANDPLLPFTNSPGRLAMVTAIQPTITQVDAPFGYAMYLGKDATNLYFEVGSHANTSWGAPIGEIPDGSANTFVYTIEGQSIESLPLSANAVYNFTGLGSGRYHVQYVSGHEIDFGGPTDRFNQGFETALQIGAEQKYKLKDSAGNLYTGPALDLEIIDVDPYVDSGVSDGTITRAGTFADFGDGNYYTFDNVDPTGFTIGDVAYIKGEVANGYPIDFKGEVVGLSSLTVKLPTGTTIGGVPSGQTPGYKNLSAFLYAITPLNTGVNDYLNTDFSYANYTFTPTGTNDEYTATFVSGDELDFGNENAVYGVFSAPTTYLDTNNIPVGGSGAHATYLYDQYGPFTATVTDMAPFTVTMSEDLQGSFLTTDISVTRTEVTQTFQGAQSFPWYFALETDTPGAGFEPISFDYPHWALDGTVFGEGQHEIETQLPVDVTTWNFFNPLFDEERHISDYDGTVFKDWRDNPTTIEEPYRYRYDLRVASNEIPDILDHYIILEDQNQDNVGNRYMIYEDGSIILKESYTDDWAQAVSFTEANGSVHSHRDWFAFTEPTIVYHNKDYVTTEVPVFLRDMGDFKPIPAPTIDMAPDVSMNVHVEVRGHGYPLIPTEFHYMPVAVDPDKGWLNPEYYMYADMEMHVISDLGDFKAIDELKVAIPTTLDGEIIVSVGINETAIRLPLGQPCGRLVNEGAYTFMEPVYAQLIHTPVSERANYYPPILEITDMNMIQETMDALLYEDGEQMLGEQMAHDYIPDTGSGEIKGYVTNHWFNLEGFGSLVDPADDPMIIGGYFPKQVTTTRGQGVGFLELESDECGMIPIEYHKEIYMALLYEPTIFAPHYYHNIEHSYYANAQIQEPKLAIEQEYSLTPYMHPSVMYVEKVSEVQDHTLIPYGLESQNFGYHHFLEDGSAIMFEDNGYILDENIPEAVRTIRYDWTLVDRQFSEYGYGSDLSRDMRGWNVITDHPAFELNLYDVEPLIVTPVMWEPQGSRFDKFIPFFFYTEDGHNLIYEDGGYMNSEEASWWKPQSMPRHIEIETVISLEAILPFEWDVANTEVIVPPQVVISSADPEYEMKNPIFMDMSATITPKTELDLAEFRVGTIYYNFPQSPVYRYYDAGSDIRTVLDGQIPDPIGGFQPADIGIAIIKPLERMLLPLEFIVDYTTATIYTYYEPEVIKIDEDLIPRVMDDVRWHEEVYLYATTPMVRVETNYPTQLEMELDIDNTILDVTGIVLPIHEEHDAIPVGTLHASSPFAEPHYEHLLLIDYRPTLFGETGQAPELLGFVTQIPTAILDITFEDMIFDTDMVMTADVFPYSQTDAGPNYFGLTPYENVWYPIGDTVLTHMRNDFNGTRINNYESFPLAKQQDSDFNSANNQWSITSTFKIETMTGINDGQNRGNQSSSKWDPFWIWSQGSQNDGSGFRLGVNNRFMIFAYGRADASETYIARLKLEDGGNFNQNYRTRIGEWYNITVTYNGMSCQEGINKNRQDFVDTEWTEGVDDPMHNQFRFYMTNLTTGVVTELDHNEHALSYANVTLAVPENFTVGGSGPQTLRNTSNTGDFSSYYEHGLKVASVAVHNRQLLIKELQGTQGENRSGFALDPEGWKYMEDSSFVYVNELGHIELEGPLDVNQRRVTPNTTQIWLFGDSRNDGFVQQSHAGIYSTIPTGNARLNDSVNLQPFGLFPLGENTTHFNVDNTNYGIGKNTPDFGTSYQLFAGDVSYIEIDYRDPFIANTQHITAQGAYTFAGNTSSLKTEYDFTHTGITADVSNLVPFDFFPIEITPFLDLTIQAYGDPLMGGNSALNNSNSQIVTSIDYDWSTIETDIDRRVLDHQEVDLGITEIPLTTLLFETVANTFTADPEGSIVSDHGIPGRGSSSVANVQQTNTTSDGMRHVECNPMIIQYGPDRMITQGDSIRLHGLIVEEPYQFILAEEDDTPIITEIYEGEDGLTTELDVFILAEGTYDTMILDSELGGEPFFLQTETGVDLDLELFEEYGDSIIAGYDTLHDFVLTERYDTVQQDDWILTHDGHTIIAEEKVRAADSEIILDSISNPRTIDDIPFDDFERFDIHDGVSTLD